MESQPGIVFVQVYGGGGSDAVKIERIEDEDGRRCPSPSHPTPVEMCNDPGCGAGAPVVHKCLSAASQQPLWRKKEGNGRQRPPSSLPTRSKTRDGPVRSAKGSADSSHSGNHMQGWKLTYREETKI